MKKTVYKLLALLGALGLIVSIIMFISAIKFGELGRVIVYIVIGILCLELLIGAFLSQKKSF